MTFFKFYVLFGIFVESFPIIPIAFAARKWKQLPITLRLFSGFLAADLILNLVSDYFYYFQHFNLFLNYFYSFFQGTFIMTMFWYFLRSKMDRYFILLMILLNTSLLVVDFVFISKMNTNYLSGLFTNTSLFLISLYIFSKEAIKVIPVKIIQNEILLTLTLTLSIQFFIKTIEIFLSKYLMETTTNAFLWIQVRNIYSYVMLICLCVYTYTIYNIKTNESSDI